MLGTGVTTRGGGLEGLTLEPGLDLVPVVDELALDALHDLLTDCSIRCRVSRLSMGCMGVSTPGSTWPCVGYRLICSFSSLEALDKLEDSVVAVASRNARRWLGRMRLKSVEEPLLCGLRDGVELQVAEYEVRELLELLVGAEPELALMQLGGVATIAELSEETECGDAA